MPPQFTPRLPCLAFAVLLALAPWATAQAQTQTPPPPPEPAVAPCARPPLTPPPPPLPPKLSAEQREQWLRHALSLNSEQARQVEALLSEARARHQPPDEERLARLLSAEQRQRLRELHASPPALLPKPPMTPPAAGEGCALAARGSDGQKPPRPTHKASAPVRPAG